MSYFTLILRPFYIIREVQRRLNKAKETPTLATKPRFHLLAYHLFEGLIMVFDDEAVKPNIRLHCNLHFQLHVV